MSYAGGGAFVDERSRLEAIEGKGGNQGMRPARYDGVRHRVPTGRNGLEASGPPTAVDKQTVYRGEAHQGARVGGDVYPPGPLPHELQATEARKELNDRADGRSLLRQTVLVAFSLARPNAGSNSAARMAMIAMTTRSSMRVKPPCPRLGDDLV